MHVDRALFLSLSAALAAASCKASNPSPYRPWNGPAMGPPGAPPPPGTPPPAGQPGWGSRQGAFAGSPPTAEGMPPPAMEGMPPPTMEGAPPPGGSTVGWREECQRMKPPGPTCEGMRSGLGMCVGAIENTHPRHHAALQSCIRSLGPGALCNERIHDQCVRPYLQSQGAGRATSASCQATGASCGSRFSAQACEGLRTSARPGFDVFPCDEMCSARCLYQDVAPPSTSQPPVFGL